MFTISLSHQLVLGSASLCFKNPATPRRISRCIFIQEVITAALSCLYHFLFISFRFICFSCLPGYNYSICKLADIGQLVKSLYCSDDVLIFVFFNCHFYLYILSFNIWILCGVFLFLYSINSFRKRTIKHIILSLYFFVCLFFNSSVIFGPVSRSQVRQSLLYPQRIKPAFITSHWGLPPCG